MSVYSIDVKIELSEDKLIDMFILQWHTPLAQGHVLSKLSNQRAKERTNDLVEFRDWLLNYLDKTVPIRPLFIISPELSIPDGCTCVLQEIVERINRPTMIIVGLEYMDWGQYQDLINSLPDMPEKNQWLDERFDKHIFNTAGIWIRDLDGVIKRFIQPKMHPQDHEQAMPVYSGQHYFVFKSTTQVGGKRLNFCVQICSDFSASQNVRDFRGAIASECPGLELDLTFLIQCNKDQWVEQFQQAVQAYFEIPDGMASTSNGCLVFVNNANEKFGKTSEWGISKLHFPHKRWRNLDFPAPTYWLHNDGPHNYQAVVLRESGPGFYWLTYKPQYLVSSIAGSGQALPFPKVEALFAPVIGQKFGGLVKPFEPILPILHWFRSESLEGVKELDFDLKSNEVNNDVSISYIESFKFGIDDWCRTFSTQDWQLRQATNLYFLWCERCKREPLNPINEPEPVRWCRQASNGVKRLMGSYSLLCLGFSAFQCEHIEPNISQTLHAYFGNDLGVVFLWGCGSAMSRKMIVDYLHSLSVEGLTTPKVLIVLVNPIDNPGSNKVKEIVGSVGNSITQTTSYEELPAHLKPPGDVVSVKGPEFICMCDNILINGVSNAIDQLDLKNRLKLAIQEVIA
ncbi:MAG: hypothetical protein P4L59_04270 [Desulfosporosinus sp.]|nr:hypothetical protein [Desulfosporosinus sp.]